MKPVMDKQQALDSAFQLRSVAIVGVAGGNEFNTGRLFLNNITEYGFAGPIYLVNPRGGEASGIKIHQRFRDIPGPVDYVISCIRAPLVPRLIKDSAARGAKAICLFTSGFSELGTREGRHLQQEIRRLAEDTGVRVIGPNCVGIHSPAAGFSFAPDFPHETGHVSCLCQSGGNTIYLVRAAGARGVRFSKVISYGNAADIDETDVLEYFARDPQTEVIAAYIEGVKDGPRFYRALRTACAAKPVVVLKGGRTRAGSLTTASHTASLSGSGRVWKDVVRQAGAISVDTMDELADMLVTFSFLPPLEGRRVAMVGIGGGAAVLAADDWEDHGFVLPELPRDIQQAWRTVLGNEAGTILRNPVDIPHLGLGQEAFLATMARLHASPSIDLLVYHLPVRTLITSAQLSAMVFDRDSDSVLKVHRRLEKPTAAVVHYEANADGWSMAAKLVDKFQQSGMATYYSIGSAARAIDRYLRYLGSRRATVKRHRRGRGAPKPAR